MESRTGLLSFCRFDLELVLFITIFDVSMCCEFKSDDDAIGRSNRQARRTTSEPSQYVLKGKQTAFPVQ
jgi:hypothetical protein